jgi:hypothetical protein
VQQLKGELGRCLPLFPPNFSRSNSNSPSPTHLLHNLTIFPAWPRVFSCITCESRLYTVVDLVLLITDGIAKEEVDKIRLRRTSLTLRTLVSFSPPARNLHSSVPRSLLPAEPQCQSYSLIETFTTHNSPFPLSGYAERPMLATPSEHSPGASLTGYVG